jgi:quinol-cytochrome oxidoreductase complex cytochrome b subunit
LRNSQKCLQAIISYFMIGYQMNFFIFFVILYALCMTSTALCVLLGSMFPNPQVADSIYPLVIVPQFYFSGLFISTNLIPSWINWAQWLCSMKYSAGLAFMYEFADCQEGLASVNCDRILYQNSVNPNDKWWYWLAMVAIFVVFRLVALLVLRKKGANFS